MAPPPPPSVSPVHKTITFIICLCSEQTQGPVASNCLGLRSPQSLQGSFPWRPRSDLQGQLVGLVEVWGQCYSHGEPYVCSCLLLFLCLSHLLSIFVFVFQITCLCLSACWSPVLRLLVQLSLWPFLSQSLDISAPSLSSVVCELLSCPTPHPHLSSLPLSLSLPLIPDVAGL